jgi:hypothetical protein
MLYSSGLHHNPIACLKSNLSPHWLESCLKPWHLEGYDVMELDGRGLAVAPEQVVIFGLGSEQQF